MSALASIRLTDALRAARLCNASDLHLCANSVPVMRVDGKLQAQEASAISAAEICEIAGALFAERDVARVHAGGDVTTAYRHGTLGSFRIHAYRTMRGESLAVRLLAPAVPSLESLRLPAIVADLVQRRHGLVLFAGPTGSGKSTALAAAIDRLNRTQAVHIVTIEDPIEYEHQRLRSTVSQREIGRDVGSYAQGIRGALRSDPDVILLGEMRDPETMQTALAAAETGHLVFATVHTSDAPQTIDRVVSAFPGELQGHVRTQLAQTLIGVICLRLVLRAEGTGRRAATEVLVASDAVRSLIRENKAHQLRNAIATGRHAGMQTLESDLRELVMRGEITLEEACKHTDRASELRAAETSAS